MPFARPSLSQLIDTAAADLTARFPGADSGLRRRVLGVFARVIAGAAHGLYGFLQWSYNQLFPDTADTANLRRHASFWKIEPKAATAAAGLVDLTGADGSTVPAETLLQRSDGVEYLTQALATIAAGAASVAVEAVAPGANGMASAGVALTFASPVAGVSSAATVGAGGLVGGEDGETDPALLSRVLQRMGSVPNGGSDADYVRWTREVASVTQAWVKPGWMGAGSVGITFICAGREDIIPTDDDVAAVEAHLAPLTPVTATIYVFKPTPAPLDVGIQVNPDTVSHRAAIVAELDDLMRREANPGATTQVTHVRSALAAVSPGSVLISPAADVAHDPHELATLGEVDWS